MLLLKGYVLFDLQEDSLGGHWVNAMLYWGITQSALYTSLHKTHHMAKHRGYLFVVKYIFNGDNIIFFESTSVCACQTLYIKSLQEPPVPCCTSIIGLPSFTVWKVVIHSHLICRVSVPFRLVLGYIIHNCLSGSRSSSHQNHGEKQQHAAVSLLPLPFTPPLFLPLPLHLSPSRSRPGCREQLLSIH